MEPEGCSILGSLRFLVLFEDGAFCSCGDSCTENSSLHIPIRHIFLRRVLLNSGTVIEGQKYEKPAKTSSGVLMKFLILQWIRPQPPIENLARLTPAQLARARAGNPQETLKRTLRARNLIHQPIFSLTPNFKPLPSLLFLKHKRS